MRPGGASSQLAFRSHRTHCVRHSVIVVPLHARGSNWSRSCRWGSVPRKNRSSLTAARRRPSSSLTQVQKPSSNAVPLWCKLTGRVAHARTRTRFGARHQQIDQTGGWRRTTRTRLAGSRKGLPARQVCTCPAIHALYGEVGFRPHPGSPHANADSVEAAAATRHGDSRRVRVGRGAPTHDGEAGA